MLHVSLMFLPLVVSPQFSVAEGHKNISRTIILIVIIHLLGIAPTQFNFTVKLIYQLHFRSSFNENRLNKFWCFKLKLHGIKF